MKLTTHLKSDYQFESVSPEGVSLHMDMLPVAEKQHFSPMQLLLSAVGGCAAVDLVQMVKKRRKTVNGLRIESEGERRETEPKRFVRIHLKFILESPDATEEELNKLLALAIEKYCSVSATLAPDLDLTYEGVVE